MSEQSHLCSTAAYPFMYHGPVMRLHHFHMQDENYNLVPYRCMKYICAPVPSHSCAYTALILAFGKIGICFEQSSG